MKKGWVKKLGIIVGVLIVMQFIGINKQVPTVEPAMDFMAVETPPSHLQELIKNACYDCHSYETKYPSYSNIAPISWVIGNHVKDGRKHLNFSIWDSYSDEIKRDILYKSYKQTGARLMPLYTYVIMHKEAKIPNKELKELYTWFKERSADYDKQLTQ